MKKGREDAQEYTNKDNELITWVFMLNMSNKRFDTVRPRNRKNVVLKGDAFDDRKRPMYIDRKYKTLEACVARKELAGLKREMLICEKHLKEEQVNNV